MASINVVYQKVNFAKVPLACVGGLFFFEVPLATRRCQCSAFVVQIDCLSSGRLQTRFEVSFSEHCRRFFKNSRENLVQRYGERQETTFQKDFSWNQTWRLPRGPCLYLRVDYLAGYGLLVYKVAIRTLYKLYLGKSSDRIFALECL